MSLTGADARPGEAASGFDARGALIGALVMTGFGLGWTAWGAGALDRDAAGWARIAGFAVGFALLAAAASAFRRSPPGSGTSMTGTRAYWSVVAAEAVAVVGGAAILGGTGLGRYVAALVAVIVGVHFLVFGRLFWRGFRVVGGVLLLGAAGSVVAGLAGAADPAVIGIAAFVAAGDLYATSAVAVAVAVRARPGG